MAYKKHKELIEAYLDEYRKVHGYTPDTKWIFDVIRLSDGIYVRFDKPSIKTSFCFGNSDIGQGPTVEESEESAEIARTSEEYFLKENLRKFDSLEKKIKDGDMLIVAKDVKWDTWECGKTAGYEFVDSNFDFDKCKNCYIPNLKDEILIIDTIHESRKAFETRLHAYLKRYGLSKLHVWTFWLDA